MMPVRRQLGIAEAHRHLILRSALEQRHRRRVRHLALEPGLDLGLILHVPARKESGERQFRINDQIRPAPFCLVHQGEHARDNGFPAFGSLDRAHLSGGNLDNTHGRTFSLLSLRAELAKNGANRRLLPCAARTGIDLTI